MTKLHSALVRDYLKRLDRISRPLPRARRSELREEIEQHLIEAIPEDADAPEVKYELDRLGTPEQIVAAERERLSIVRTSATWGEFFIWALLGGVAAFGLLAFGLIALVLILLGGWVATTRPGFRHSGFGILAGVGAAMLYVAYVQRHGPGLVCWHTATESGCDQYANPWPWLLVGALVVLVSFLAHARRMRLERRIDRS